LKTIAIGTLLTLLLTGIAALAFSVQSVKSDYVWTDIIYIKADGSIEPLGAPVSTIDNVTYTLTDNIIDAAQSEWPPGVTAIIVQRDNIVIDGDGYTLQGTGIGIGVYLSQRENVTVRNAQIKNFGSGIIVTHSANCSVSGNNITNNDIGVELGASSNYNNISRNNITNNSYGISFARSSYNSIRDNTFTNDGIYVWDSYQNIVENNTVNGKPLVYLEDVANHSVGDAGQVILVNCTGIRVENLDLSYTTIGVQLWQTSNTTISGNDITENNYYGILFDSTSNCNNISGNNITNNSYGVEFGSSSNYNNMSGNNITENKQGIVLISSNNIVSGNNIANNEYGINLVCCSSGNIIYHNNFLNNTEQVYFGPFFPLAVATWDDGYPSGGNYWSNYNGTDWHCSSSQNETGSDGIGDTAYEIRADNRDRYPLMGPFNMFDAGTWNEVSYNVDIISNSTISDFHFNPAEGAFLRFNVNGTSETVGFCRVTIPKNLLWVEDGWTITVSGQPIAEYGIISDGNFTYLYFSYSHSTQMIIIQGNHAIPEFPSFAILLLLMILTIFAVAYMEKRLPRKP
jgi:parallel beta-helix repeat protein